VATTVVLNLERGGGGRPVGWRHAAGEGREREGERGGLARLVNGARAAAARGRRAWAVWCGQAARLAEHGRGRGLTGGLRPQC
jgi:hypothetical protein